MSDFKWNNNDFLPLPDLCRYSAPERGGGVTLVDAVPLASTVQSQKLSSSQTLSIDWLGEQVPVHTEISSLSFSLAPSPANLWRILQKGAPVSYSGACQLCSRR